MNFDDQPPAPTINPELYTRLDAALASEGPLAAIDRLCDELRAAEDYQNLFYAKLMRKRVELGVAPFPTGPSTDLPPETHEPYEDAIRQAGREVGQIYLDKKDIPKAWAFFRMLGEPQPVKDALREFQADPDTDTYPIVEVAWQQGVLPEKGFDLILDRQGVCSAITMVHSSDLTQNPPLREYCVRRLVRALHQQLQERLRADLEGRGITVPEGATITEMITGRDEIFADDLYHIDVSHLSSVVQMAMHLSAGPELDMARELCRYGAKLSPVLRGESDPPFENSYADYGVYLDVLAGHDVDRSLAHFTGKLGQAASEGYLYPAEVAVNLLLKRGRVKEALQVARQYLASEDERQLSCPGVTELAKQVGDYGALAEAARTKADPVTYLAGRIASRG